MKKKWLTVLLIAGMIAVLVLARTTTPDSSVIVADEMTPLSLELVYEGSKPDGVGSVQSFAITPDYFVVAGRPPGTAEEGGETNNRIMVIDRMKLDDVSERFDATMGLYELGHANGMTYDPVENRLLVVSVDGELDNHDAVAQIDARNFEQGDNIELASGSASGIAYMGGGNFVIRSGGWIRFASGNFSRCDDAFYFSSGLAVQDIGYYNDYVYLADWARWKEFGALLKIGLRENENVIYRFDEQGNVKAFLISSPRHELESIDFIDGEAYVLMNGFGRNGDSFFIYKIVNNEAGTDFVS